MAIDLTGMPVLTLTAAAACLSGLALASALLATTPACALLNEAEASGAVGERMELQGGTAETAAMSGCLWQGAQSARLEFSLQEAELFAPSGRSAADAFEDMVGLMRQSGQPPEIIPGIGDRAALIESDGARFGYVVAGGGYLSFTLTGGSREAALAIARIAAGRM